MPIAVGEFAPDAEIRRLLSRATRDIAAAISLSEQITPAENWMAGLGSRALRALSVLGAKTPDEASRTSREAIMDACGYFTIMEIKLRLRRLGEDTSQWDIRKREVNKHRYSNRRQDHVR
jgi:hypothetical protein